VDGVGTRARTVTTARAGSGRWRERRRVADSRNNLTNHLPNRIQILRDESENADEAHVRGRALRRRMQRIHSDESSDGEELANGAGLGFGGLRLQDWEAEILRRRTLVTGLAGVDLAALQSAFHARGGGESW
jgi:hypothetical protein